MPQTSAPPPAPPRAAADPPDPRESHDNVGVNSMRQLIQLRWIAVIGQLLTISLVHSGLDIALPLAPMLAVLAALALFNGAAVLR